ncbi:MAG: radical SAM protein [Oscillospiraceae bacterium]|nr:radical SAM protein [Candidatus Limimonas egerieequi]
MQTCNLCPRNCKVNRNIEAGVCGEFDTIRIARASLHMWEEPPISGTNGSGTVFFTGCPLHCVFCQNHNIADGTNGIAITVDELSAIFLKLQEIGAHNINLVTATHFVPDVVSAINKAKENGLVVPIVYNTSGYETVETLGMLDGIVDVYLPDFKYVSAKLSSKYSNAKDYFDVASKALSEMFRQVGTPQFDGDLIKKGVVVRHLILPGCTDDSKAVLDYLYRTYGDDIFISIMNQYTPLSAQLARYPELDRTLTDAEYDEVVDFAVELGITNAFVQEGAAAQESFIPDFENWDKEEFLK